MTRVYKHLAPLEPDHYLVAAQVALCNRRNLRIESALSPLALHGERGPVVRRLPPLLFPHLNLGCA